MTTPSNEQLDGLLERVRAAAGPDRDLDTAICIALQYGGKNSEGATNVRTDPEWGDDGDLLFEIGKEECCNSIPELTASIDAALALVERLLPDWVVTDLSQNSVRAGDPWGCTLALYFGSTPSKNRSASSGYYFSKPSLAILAALLTALKDASE